jgi:deoxyribose-phosphate aldolase
VKKILDLTSIKVTTVANFPKGNTSTSIVLSEIKTAIDMGADEIDVVIPYAVYLNQENSNVIDFTQQCVEICHNRATLKTIIETGALQQEALITKASEDVIKGKTNFIKTSTGKVSQGACFEAVKTILQVIKKNQCDVGIKISGGIQTIQQALDYLNLIKEKMSDNWISAKRVRFGTSKLLDDLA